MKQTWSSVSSLQHVTADPFSALLPPPGTCFKASTCRPSHSWGCGAPEAESCPPSGFTRSISFQSPAPRTQTDPDSHPSTEGQCHRRRPEHTNSPECSTHPLTHLPPKAPVSKRQGDQSSRSHVLQPTRDRKKLMALAVLTRKATQLDSSLHDRHIVILEESEKKII